MNVGPPEIHPLSPVQAVVLVARRELLTRIRSRMFVILTVSCVALIGIYAVLQLAVIDRLSTGNSGSTFHVGFTAQSEPLAVPTQEVASTLGFTVRSIRESSLPAAEGQLRAGTLDALVTGAPAAPLVLVKSQLDPTLQGALKVAVKQVALSSALRSAGVNEAGLETAALQASIAVQVIQPIQSGALAQAIMGAILAFLLYLFLQIYGGVIAQGVVTEKASRVVEVLLATVRAGELLVGKVLGIGMAGLLQFAVIVGFGVAITIPTGVLSIPAEALGGVLGGLLWFALGFVLYALIIATLASLVSRVEEVASSTLPFTLLIVIAWLLAYVVFIPEISAAQTGAVIPAGVENLGTVTSLIPFFSPVLMPIRMATGDAPLWQVLLAVVLTLACIAGVARLGARVYVNSVLRFGARIRLFEALRQRR